MADRAAGVEHALLGLLRGRPMHAYEMARRLAHGEALGRVWRIKQSHLYALLNSLEADGYLGATTESHGARPPRRVLHLTPEGEAAFRAWSAAPVRHGRDFRLEFLAKLYFAEREGPVAVADLIARQRAECERWLSRLRAQTDELDAGQRFDRLVLGFRRSQIAALVAWLDECAAAPVGGTPLPSQPST
jgi:DNA-binding PadR family transcriptional regulator